MSTYTLLALGLILAIGIFAETTIYAIRREQLAQRELLDAILESLDRLEERRSGPLPEEPPALALRMALQALVEAIGQVGDDVAVMRIVAGRIEAMLLRRAPFPPPRPLPRPMPSDSGVREFDDDERTTVIDAAGGGR